MRPILFCLAVFCATPACSSSFTANDIRREIAGRTVYLAAPFGGEFPLNYRKSGVVDGDGQALGLGRLVKPSDQGRWWIKGDKLCQQFKTWYDGAVLCFELSRTAPGRLRWVRDNGESGLARIGDEIR